MNRRKFLAFLAAVPVVAHVGLSRARYITCKTFHLHEPFVVRNGDVYDNCVFVAQKDFDDAMVSVEDGIVTNSLMLINTFRVETIIA